MAEQNSRPWELPGLRWCGRRSKLFLFLIFSIFLLLTMMLLPLIQRDDEEEEVLHAGAVKDDSRMMIWWNAFNETPFTHKIYSGFDLCTITNDRKRLKEAKVIFFYGPNLTTDDMPMPRQPWQLWALLHAESPQGQEILLYEYFMQHFNYTSTFSRYSDFPLTLLQLPDARELVKSTYLLPLYRRNSHPILFIENNCDTLSGREDYVRELMSYVLVDSCGKCLRNSDSPRLKRENDLLRFMAKYKFIFAFEDAICDDYISSTYWLALTVGAIPIYFGSPTIRDWEPHNHSAIYISDYASPKDLAIYISYLDGNDTAFNEYLYHKYNRIAPITNPRLYSGLLWYSDRDRKNEFRNFEEEMCREINRDDLPKYKVANRTHMDCPLPQPYRATVISNKVQHEKKWNVILSVRKCTAYLLDKLLRINKSNFNANFTSKLQALVGMGFC